MNDAEITSLIIDALKKNGLMSKADLVEIINRKAPGYKATSISWKLHNLKLQGLIQSPGYGTYSYQAKNTVQWSISAALKRYFNKIHKEFPFIEICIWDSRWFNPLMLHQPFKYYIVIEVEKEAAESVFNSMTDVSKKVFLNPTEEIFSRYISNFTEAIIIKPLISEAPIMEQEGIKVATIEKLLVDSVADKELFAAQQGELDYIYRNAWSKYNININKLKRYARRRNQTVRVKELLLKTMAK